MRALNTVISAILLLLWAAACVDPFELESVGDTNFLVVEGFLSDRAKRHKIKLSRSGDLTADQFTLESGAQVYVEDGSGARINYSETNPGIYETEAFASGVVGRTYNLIVILSNGSSYVSDPVTLRSTPPMTEIKADFLLATQNDDIDRNIFRFTVDTEDPDNLTRFYRWEWEETYEIQTPLVSRFVWIEGPIINDRLNPTNRCWASDTSNNIIIKSTEGLERDIIQNQTIHTFRSFTEAMRVRYSILIRQMSLSEESFRYWNQLKSFNETPGGLFDIQPASVVGNIRSVDNQDEVVLGYFDAAQVQEERKFYTPMDFVGQGFIPTTDALNCDLDTLTFTELGPFMEQRTNTMNPFEVIDIIGNGVSVAPTICTDCTNRGINQEPEFWDE
ncbi:MAG: DUF4249 domain-containing protein [Cyclobacteriaceae bacterium]